jgi:hypothetical protein
MIQAPIYFKKRIFKPLRNYCRNSLLAYRLDRLKNQYLVTKVEDLDPELFKSKILGFLNSLEIGPFLYKYSNSCSRPTLYASAYACMTRSLLGDLNKQSQELKSKWRDYFDSFQSSTDGLFYDPVVQNDIYNDTDWWGARHLALHMISSYTDLGYRPKHPFKFLNDYYSKGFIKSWLDHFDWRDSQIGSTDIDNKIMNIGCMLQYQRDTWGDVRAGRAVEVLKQYLRGKLNTNTGMWGSFDTNDPEQRSRMVQFAYHLFPLFFYDGDFDFDADLIVKHTLATQNRLGGFGVKLNSSACEDIDSIDILLRMHRFCSLQKKPSIEKVVEKAFSWVLFNQVEDNGFVFRREEPFVYGSSQTSSLKNESAMLPTWFRTLSIAYMYQFLTKSTDFCIVNSPGYEFQ